MDAQFARRIPKTPLSPKTPERSTAQVSDLNRTNVDTSVKKSLFDSPVHSASTPTSSTSDQENEKSNIPSEFSFSFNSTSSPTSPRSPYNCRYIPSRSSSDLKNGLLSPSPPRSNSKNSNFLNGRNGLNKPAAARNLFENEDAPPSSAPPSTSTSSQLLYSQLLQQQLNLSTSIFQYSAKDPLNDISSSHLSTGGASVISRNKYAPEISPRKALVASSILNPSSCSCGSMDTNCMCGLSNRKINPTPVKVLDAPNLQDDFYLNLLDWGKTNNLAVGLGDACYLWNATTAKVTKVAAFADEGTSVTSVAWAPTGVTLSVGCSNGLIKLYDISRMKLIRTLPGHSARVGCLAWNSSNELSSGSRDRSILHCDLRAPEPYALKMCSHKQEVCGLKWSVDGKQLASGGNDNKLMIWQPGHHSSSSSSLASHVRTNPVLKFNEHTAAVKAIAWSPHQNGVVASGGGTADRCIRFFNTITGVPLHFEDTGSQVCNLAFSENSMELVSTHGYSQNQIVVWKYPSMKPLATLTGHTYRVLYLSVSPDGQSIATGAGDETLRIWNVFPAKSKPFSASSPSMHLAIR